MVDVDINKVKNIDPIKIQELSNIDPFKIQEVSNVEPLRVAYVQNIAPVAAHIKEVNHIDPITLEALHVNEVKNIDPIRVPQFNVTNLPMVNVSLRQLPAVEMNVRRLPPLSVGLYQNLHIPSQYTVRARFLGFEFLRLHLNGCTTIAPQERYRREQERVPSRSFAVPATAGNPAIPSIRREESATVRLPAGHGPPGLAVPLGPGVPAHPPAFAGHPPGAYSGWAPPAMAGPGVYGAALGSPQAGSALSVGLPPMSFHIPDAGPSAAFGGSSVSSGE